MKIRHLFTSLTLAFALAAFAPAQAQTDPAALLAEAEARLAADPADRKALVAAARASIVLKDTDRAIRYLEQLREGSENFAVRQALLLQYAEAQNWGQHAAIQDEVLGFFAAGKLPDELTKRDVFGVEIYRHGDFDVRAYRHFEPKGTHRHVYTSVVSRPDAPAEPPVMITFGSTEATDLYDLQQNRDRPYERLYSLDTHIRPDDGGYWHETLGFETAMMDYPAYRQVVIDYLDGKREPVSAAGSQPPKE